MAVDYLSALGAGSGIDTKNLVESLVAAERQPLESRLNKKIEDSEAQVSAYGTVMSSLQLLEAAFQQINDVSEFSNFTSTISNGLSSAGAASFQITTDSDVTAGRHEISVTSIATPDRWVSEGFAETTTELNGGSAFSVTIDFEDVSKESAVISVSDSTPQGLVDAINATSYGLSASLVDTGDASTPYKIVLTGDLGADNAFTATTDIASGTSVNFASQLSDASNSSLTLDGVTISRSSNTIDDLIDGVEIELFDSSASVGVVQIAADTSVIEGHLRNLVTSYNTVATVFKSLKNPDSTDDLGGSLSGDSLFRIIETKVKQMFTEASSTPGESLSYLSDLGIGMTRSGTLEINETLLADALSANYADVVTMLSADTEYQSEYGVLDRGIAGDALATISELTGTDGLIRSRTSLAEGRIADYESDLEALSVRMEMVSQRYLKQFTAMEQIVDRMNSTREFLEQQIDALPYNNRNS